MTLVWSEKTSLRLSICWLASAFCELNTMKSPTPMPQPQEIELKLALLAADPTNMEKKLAQTPVLSCHQSTHLQLHNVYYDTPEQALRQAHAALRLRRTGNTHHPHWLQTLKVGGDSHSALSQRGEWEAPVPGEELALHALKGTPWSDIDSDGTLFGSLSPSFETSFERTSWMVDNQNGTVIEVSLDIGKIMVGGNFAPICELELELKAGPATALFEIARQIAQSVAVMPLSQSKSERGYALAQGTLHAPVRAQSPKLTSDMPVLLVAKSILSEMFSQFTTNLNALRFSESPEVLHQARVGWRRLRSAKRLFKPILPMDTAPTWEVLLPLLTFMGELRDLDVARKETLPLLADSYTEGQVPRIAAWLALDQGLARNAALQRKSIRYALADPVVGAALLETTQWLEALSVPIPLDPQAVGRDIPVRRWVRRRIARIHERLKYVLEEPIGAESQHQIRISSKRLRYAIEALLPLWPKRKTRRWYRQALELQTRIGLMRDLLRAGELAALAQADPRLVGFLQGVAVGKTKAVRD